MPTSVSAGVGDLPCASLLFSYDPYLGLKFLIFLVL